MLFAPMGGILLQHKTLGALVKTGETIATIYDLNGIPLSDCHAPGDGFIAAQLLMAAVSPGDLVEVIFKPED
jgi:predicted deacylase